MRLINTATLRLQEFFDSERPKYAILSHTWGKEEVSLQEWMKRTASIEAKSGFDKIIYACRVARRQGHDYLWVDTNCIDKKSSAELSEAINSMFSWYRASEVCYAYLEDFPEGAPTKDMSRCRWFTRGWTLQELLAPQLVTFFNAKWESVGTKTELCNIIREATGIGIATLCDPTAIDEACAAKKMSWASSRQTTRLEDMAYCLLGLFDISMPLLYGEGNNAFRRLQEEIMSVSTDQSLFAWDWPSALPDSYNQGKHLVTILAPSPSAFEKCHVVRSHRQIDESPGFSMTNFGLKIAMPLLVGEPGAYFGVLACGYETHEDSRICIPLSYCGTQGVFHRDDSRGFILLPTLYLPRDLTLISFPRHSQPEGKLPQAYLRPGYREVSLLLFPLHDTLKYWKIHTSWGHLRTSQRMLVERENITYDIWTESIIARSRKNDRQWVFIILWTPELDRWHLCAERYYGDFYDDVDDKILKRAVRNAHFTESLSASRGDLSLSVGNRYAMVNDAGGRCVPLFLDRVPADTVAIRQR
ncbi:HET domain containing protein [Colletotrichum kahawae]|uniref:HET domain containing protein n=1 Tax=Colletotrichum kahawae TaxID=34407 RepID=A0AAD9Y6T5_COLKA|nr:HET domain containing protein [Colletotrichum kahawae]